LGLGHYNLLTPTKLETVEKWYTEFMLCLNVWLMELLRYMYCPRDLKY